MASSGVPAAKPSPKGLIRTVAPEIFKKGVKATADYLAREAELDRNRSLGDRFMSTFVEKPAQILKFASVDLPRYTLGSFASVGKSVMEATLGSVVGKENVRKSFTPDTPEARKVNEFFFKDENPLSYQQLKEQVDAFAAESEDATPWEKANLGTTIAILGFAADAIPGKPSAATISKKLLKELAKDIDEAVIVTKLIAEGVPEAVATRAAAKVAAAKTPNEVQRAVQQATKEALDETADLTTKGTARAVSESIPEALRPLAQEARKFDNADDFRKNFTVEGNRGTFFHLTDDPNFKISKDIAPSDLSSIANGKGAQKGLMVTGDLDAEAVSGLGREFVAIIDTTKLPTNKKSQVARGFGNEIFIDADNLDDVGVVKVVPIEEARKIATEQQELLAGTFQTKEDFARFYDKANGVQEITGSPLALGSSEPLAAPTTIGKPHTTPGMTVLDQSGETPDPVQVERAFAGEYTAGDGVSRTTDEIAQDIMTTTAEPILAARTVSSLQSAKTKILEYFQNTEERIRKLQEDPSLRIGDDSNPYQQMTLMPGRVGAQIENIQKRLGDVFVDMETTARAGGRKLEDVRKDVNEFLWLRHAPERNAALKDGAAGITTKEAAKRMEILKASPQYDDIVRLGDELAAMNKESLDTLLDAGVITPKLYETLTDTYKNYVPLNRIMDSTSDVSGILSGRGFDVKSTGIRRAKGSDREVADIVENTILNYEQAVIRAEKNIVDRATLQFVQENKQALEGTMRVRRPRGLETTDDPQILQLFDQGKRVWIQIEDPNLAIAFKGTGRQQLPHILYPVAAFTRLMSGLATRFNPEFAFSNILRDIQERTVFLSAQKGLGGKEAFKAVGRDASSVKAVTDFVLGRDTPDAALYAEMKSLGGTTGGMGLSTRKKAELNIRHLEQMAKKGPRKYAESAIEYIDNWNTIFEDSTRLTTYKTALANGMSKKQAAALAKEATVNFNRMGKGGPVINAGYMFANASIQGSVKTLRAMKNPKVLMGLTVIVGTAVTAVNEWNDSVDPNWRKKISKWDVVNSLPIVLPSDDGSFKTFTIPVAYGIKPMRVAADYAYQLANDQDVTALDMTEGVISAIMESYNPIGGTDLMSSATPTILDLPLEIARNQKWSGSVIKPDFDPYAPESTRYFDSLEDKTAGKVAISLTEQLAGWGVEVSPADVVYAFESYIGGAGRSAERFIDVGAAALPGNDLPPISDFPFISRFYKEKAEDEIFNTQSQSNLKELLGEDRRERFYLGKKADAAWDSIAELSPAEKKTKLKELSASDPELFEKVLDIAEAEKMGLVGEERQLKNATVSVRASYIAGELKTLKTKEERKALLQNYIDKKIATEAVIDALAELKAEQK